jgi:N-acetyl-S-(2-succino)cysteine monooxygenase
MPPVLPSGLEAFTDHVIPLLRKRGVFRTEYTRTHAARALRDPRPENHFTATARGGLVPA